MTDEINEEILSILTKMAVRLDDLEKIVFDKNNILMKSGLVVVTTPKPSAEVGTDMPDSEQIHKMEWDQLNDLTKRITGE